VKGTGMMKQVFKRRDGFEGKQTGRIKKGRIKWKEIK
jgi:hypothetical protein